jgi:hypothetical protein
MSQPFAIRCCTCKSIWEAESLSTLIQCPYCLGMLELETPQLPAPSVNQVPSGDQLRWELARVLTIQAISRWRARLLVEQPQLTDLPYEPRSAWWTEQRYVWRGIAILSVMILLFIFAPWQLSLALMAAVSYAIVIHPGWNRDERLQQTVKLREQTLPLLIDLPRSDFTSAGRYADAPFDAAAWLQSTWGNHRSGEVFQILGWQQKVLQEISDTKSANASVAEQHGMRGYLHETKTLGTDLN